MHMCPYNHEDKSGHKSGNICYIHTNIYLAKLTLERLIYGRGNKTMDAWTNPIVVT